MNDRYVLICILVSAAALPFTILGKRKQIPEKIRYLGRILPAAIMAVLIVYCLKEVPTEFLSGGYKKLIAAAVCVALHVWKKNTFVSIIGSTIVYMLL
jgi:branched-subunit amino acid transport protein AzlD